MWDQQDLPCVFNYLIHEKINIINVVFIIIYNKMINFPKMQKINAVLLIYAHWIIIGYIQLDNCIIVTLKYKLIRWIKVQKLHWLQKHDVSYWFSEFPSTIIPMK